MDEHREGYKPELIHTEPESSPSRVGAWLGGLAALAVALIIIAAVAIAYGYRAQTAVGQLTSHESDMTATISQLQNQIDSLTAKLQTATQPPAAPTANGQPVASSRDVTKWRTADNRRIKQLQSQLTDQQKQLKDEQDAVAQTRTDLEGNISSTRDELNGSIARTHDELVTLEQKGERNYFEFDLTKAKQFQHSGPVMISLRKADPKHKRYDLAMIVDDNQISKKNVNLYEPVWISTDNNSQLQVVVNKIDKNHVHGYVSAPKYNASAQTTGQTVPVSLTTSAPANDATSTPDTNQAAPAGASAGSSFANPQQQQQ